MTLPQIVSRNNIQKTNKRVIPWTNDVIQPTVWYTCPTGKIAILKGICTCVDTGAAADASLNAQGVRIAHWLATGGVTDINDPLTGFKESIVYPFQIELSAGGTIETVQDSGTNAQFKLQAEIEEFLI